MAMVTVIAGRRERVPAAARTPRCGVAWTRAGRDPALRSPGARAAAGRCRPTRTCRTRCSGCATAAAGSRCSRSRRPRPRRRVLANAGIREHFEHVLSAPECGAFKPEDLAYHGALEKLGATEAWFVAGPLVGRRGRGLRRAEDGVGEPHGPRLPARDARAGRPRHRHPSNRQGDTR